MPRLLAFLALPVLAGCAAPPMGPLVRVMPGPDKPYAQFLADDDGCRASAQSRVAGQAENANVRGVGIGALTTVAGTALGAIAGGGRGAAVGAVAGGGLGLGLGAGSSAGAQGGIQAQYDAAYAQCMYAAGNQVPGVSPASPPVAYQAPPPPAPAPSPVGYAGPIRDPLVRDIQRQLRRHGYYPGPTDGVATPQVISAIQAFQAAHGIQPDGVPSPYLLNTLRLTPPGG